MSDFLSEIRQPFEDPTTYLASLHKGVPRGVPLTKAPV